MHPKFQEAVAHFQAGRLPEAESLCRKLLATSPRDVNVLQLLGLTLSKEGKHVEGAAALEKSLKVNPRQPVVYCNLGEIYRLAGNLKDAERVLREALRLQPQFAEAAFNLGNALKDQDRYSDAILSFQKAVEIRPNYGKAHLNLANTLRLEGRLPRAIRHYNEFLRLEPPQADVLMSLGGAHSELQEHATALGWYQKAAQLDPNNEEVEVALGNAALALGRFDDARVAFGRLASRRPECLLRKLRHELLCDVIAPDSTFIDEHRREAAGKLQQMRDDRRLSFALTDLESSCAEPPMPWTYQGRDERPLKEAYAALFADAIRPLELPRRNGKPHVGVVVTSGHEGVYVECVGRLVARLSRAEMDVTVVSSRAGINILKHLMPDADVTYLRIPGEVTKAAETLRDAAFDLLHYWEIGTDSTNYFLPFFRPAPVQSTCWGWPSTSGQPHVHSFVSSRFLEPEGGAAHYTEQLVLLDALPTWYRRPPVPTALRGREAFGIAAKCHAYICTQNVRKYHPDFDAVVGEILRRDPAGRMYFIEDSQPPITQLLKDRFKRSLPDVAGRITFVRRMEKVDYLNFVCLADVMLDTLHYGGGANSLFDAFACGTPVVTLPGTYHRGRWGAGAYARLGIPDLVVASPEEYVAKAVAVASTPDMRQDLGRRIVERSAVLFEDDSAVRAHEEFFQQAVARSRES